MNTIKNWLLWLGVTLLLVAAVGGGTAWLLSGDKVVDDFTVPDQKILGAEELFEQGELARLTVSPPKEKSKNLLKSTYTWKVLDDGKEKSFEERGDGIFFGTGRKDRKLLAVLAVTHLVKVGKEVRTYTSILVADVIIGPAPPGPGPGPGPEPDPVFPDGKFKLAKWAWQQARDKVHGEIARTKGSKVLSNSFKSLSESKEADVEKLLKQAKEANVAALSSADINVDYWNAFSLALQDKLYEMYQGKQLNTTADFRQAFSELSAGLGAVK